MLPIFAALGGAVIKAVGNAVSGSGTAKQDGCAQQTPTDVAAAVIAKCTAAERAKLQAMLDNGNGWARLDNPFNVAWAFAGGSDCKNTSAQGRDDLAFWESLVAKYGSTSFWNPETVPHDPRTTAAGGTIFGGAPIGTSGATVPLNPGQATPAAAGDFWTRLGMDLFGGGGGNTGAVAPPATAASVFWNPAQTQTAPTTIVGGAQVGASSQMVLMGGAALVVVLLLVAFMSSKK